MKNVKLELKHFVVEVVMNMGMDHDEVSLIAKFYDYDNRQNLISDLEAIEVVVSEVTEK